MKNTPTPHNAAKKGDFAKTMLMAGDPVRVRFIAENFLENPKLVSEVRGIFAYTGTYKGKEISVMAHGMGNPSMGIYSYELYKFYGVETIIRVGSIGAMREDINLRDIIIVEKAFTNTNYDNFYIKNNGAGYVEGNKKLAGLAEKKAKELGLNYFKGKTLCSDTFYADKEEGEVSKEEGLLGVEMETAALYLNANKLKKSALTICTVSDNVVTGEKTTSDERALGFSNMIKLALEVAINV